jgi:hypothetical protein
MHMLSIVPILNTFRKVSRLRAHCTHNCRSLLGHSLAMSTQHVCPSLLFPLYVVPNLAPEHDLSYLAICIWIWSNYKCMRIIMLANFDCPLLLRPLVRMKCSWWIIGTGLIDLDRPAAWIGATCWTERIHVVLLRSSVPRGSCLNWGLVAGLWIKSQCRNSCATEGSLRLLAQPMDLYVSFYESFFWSSSCVESAATVFW